MNEKAVIIGGGAAGMFSGIWLGKRGFDVTILEKNEKLGKKIFITGKGRCNFTNDCDDDTFFSSVKRNPKFLFSAYRAFRAKDTIAFFENAGMKTKVERGNRAFPVSDHAYDVTDALKRELKKYKVRICLHAEAAKILTDNEEHKVTGVVMKDGKIISADRVIIATGGLSYPTTGSTGDGYRFAEETGHKTTEKSPSLVPFLTKEDFSNLAGLSLKNVTLTVYNGDRPISTGFGEMLFTHKGISGPLVLTASSIAAGLDNLSLRAEIDLKPAIEEKEFDERLVKVFAENTNRNLTNALHGIYPSGMIESILKISGIDGERKVNTITKKERLSIVKETKHFPLIITGTAGYAEAVITKGGVSVKEINPKTMESKKVKGLYFAGEVIDVDALTGGFNLQIAWSTAYAAGNAQ